MSDDPAIALRGLTKGYRAKVVLDGVDLDVPRGSVVGLVGRNGAGKSTLIKCALGLIRSYAGEALLFGQDARQPDDATKARIGYAPQQPALYPWLRVERMIAYTAAFYPRWDHALVERQVADWGIERRAHVGALSPGQAQQLAIVLALGHRPDLLVLDEPAAALDPAARRRFLAAVLEVALDGARSVLFSTHLIGDLERVADRVAVLKAGRVVFSGGVDELKESVKRLRVDGAVPDLPAEVLSRQGEGGRSLVTVRGRVTEARAAVEAAGSTIEVEDLGLEDIFVELTA
ncbi:MAG TPA: ABC transporter ATP-binding protein [Planctomycetota bacterium]|nr:ABC transporter ATP-binding protein [Planctomycetota bacterium]